MLHDERHFPEPSVFKPERFLSSDGRLNESMRDLVMPAFGFGRRICPGKSLAYASLWASVSSVLCTFDVVKPTDETGRPIEPSGEYTTGLVS